MVNLDNEPEPKRKTLAERAGEPRSQLIPPTPVPRSVVQGQSLVGAGVRTIFLSLDSAFYSQIYYRHCNIRRAHNGSVWSIRNIKGCPCIMRLSQPQIVNRKRFTFKNVLVLIPRVSSQQLLDLNAEVVILRARIMLIKQIDFSQPLVLLLSIITNLSHCINIFTQYIQWQFFQQRWPWCSTSLCVQLSAPNLV